MRLFLDTNIFPEFIDRRAQYEQVCMLIDSIHDGHFDACVSTGCMYQCALENDCDVLITINIDDYKNADQSRMEILTPSAFVEKYITV